MKAKALEELGGNDLGNNFEVIAVASSVIYIDISHKFIMVGNKKILEKCDKVEFSTCFKINLLS